MLLIEIDEQNHIALLEPDGPLTEGDFASVARVIDSYLEETGQLKGIVIHSRQFPGWDSFAALASHLEFVRDHHKKLERVALVTDSIVGQFAPLIARHFVNAQIKKFPYQELEDAKKWVAEPE